jgi:hypothetical protein
MEKKPTYADLRDALAIALGVIELGDNLAVDAKNERLAKVRAVFDRSGPDRRLARVRPVCF